MTDLEWRPRHNPWGIAMTVTLATFMEVLDTTIVNVSLPHIAGSLSADQDSSTWVLTSYLVSNAIVLPASGWIANRVGRKRFYMSCVALFAASSFLCGIAPSLGTLIFFRVLQGVGGGGLQPSEQAILADTFPQEKRGMAFAIYGMAVVLAPAIGPTLGGFITDNASWRWIFFINVPVGVASLILTSRLVEDPPYVARARRQRQQVDYVGLSLVILGLGCLQYILDKGQREDWFHSPVILAFTIVAAVALIVLVIWEYFHPAPIIDIRLLLNRNFALSFAMMFMLGAALFGTTVLLPLFLQTVMGYTAQQSGEALSPGGVVVIILLPIVGKLLSRVQARWLILFGFVSLSWAMFHMTNIYPGISFSDAVWYRIDQSIALAFLFVPINTIAYIGVPIEKNNEVSSLTNLARNIGGSVGISAATTMLARRAQFHQARLVAHASDLEPNFRDVSARIASYLMQRGLSAADATFAAAGRIYGELVRQATVLAYNDTLYVFALTCAVMIPFVFLLRKNRPGAAAPMH